MAKLSVYSMQDHHRSFSLYYTILYYTILYYTILYYTILYYTILYYTILYYTIPTMLCYATAMLCCAMLRRTILYYKIGDQVSKHRIQCKNFVLQFRINENVL